MSRNTHLSWQPGVDLAWRQHDFPVEMGSRCAGKHTAYVHKESKDALISCKLSLR